MASDDRLIAEDPRLRRNRRQVAAWLFCICAMLLVMIGLGGATRLTGSGLSIMEWAPVRGVLPPMDEAEWTRLFDLYRQIPQYSLMHAGMGLAGFKGLFWLEWIHRFWGRMLGFAFLLPLLWFWARGALERRFLPWLVLFFVLGGLQGAVGWFMVESGFLPDSTAVSAYRLVAHLVLALLLYAAILWTGLTVLTPAPAALPGRGAWATRRLVAAASVLVALTIVAGGFMAGTHAGLTYNTFPLMDGRLFPEGYAALHPFLRNLAENIPAVQFDHRLLATLTLVTALAAVATGLRAGLQGALRLRLLALGATVVLQFCLGLATLLLVVPVELATIHQCVAALLLAASLVALHGLRGARRPAPRGAAAAPAAREHGAPGAAPGAASGAAPGAVR
jgi:heme a synthase